MPDNKLLQKISSIILAFIIFIIIFSINALSQTINHYHGKVAMRPGQKVRIYGHTGSFPEARRLVIRKRVGFEWKRIAACDYKENYSFTFKIIQTGKFVTKACLYDEDGHEIYRSPAKWTYVLKLKRKSKLTNRKKFSWHKAFSYTHKLTSYGNRYVTKKKAHKKALDYICKTLKSFGYSPVKETFSIGNGLKGTNIIAVNNKDYSYQPEWLNVGAHYDSEGGPGALDNASGAGVLLELARDFSTSEMPYTVKFVFFDSEEKKSSSGVSHPGSKYNYKHLGKSAKQNLSAMINLDTVGYLKSSLVVGDMNSGKSWISKHLRLCARQLKIKVTIGTGRYFQGLSDYGSFAEQGIPIAAVATESPYNHSASDTIDKVSKSRINQVGYIINRSIASLE